jgi:putative heme iron utilization protein
MADASNNGPSSGPNSYDALAQTKELLRAVRSGALATLVPAQNCPFASLVNVATTPDGSPILLMSRLAAHTRHLEADPRLSLLLVQTGEGDPLAHPRITIMGKGEVISDPDRRATLKARFLARHPKSALYADFADFSFWQVTMEQVHLNGGFSRAAHFKAAAIATSLEGADSLVAAEEQALAQVNAEGQDLLHLFATALAGKPNGLWQATGIDPQGMDLACADLTARIAFPKLVQNLPDLREILTVLAESARRAATKPASDR